MHVYAAACNSVIYNQSLSKWCLFMLVYFIKSCIFVNLCQTRVDRRYHKTNISWQGCTYSDMLTLEDNINFKHIVISRPVDINCYRITVSYCLLSDIYVMVIGRSKQCSKTVGWRYGVVVSDTSFQRITSLKLFYLFSI